jgi:hypothetical protein
MYKTKIEKLQLDSLVETEGNPQTMSPEVFNGIEEV